MLEFNLYKGCFWNILKEMNRSIKSHIPYHWLWVILKICQFWWKMDQLRMELSCDQAPLRASSENWVRQFGQKSSDKRATEGAEQSSQVVAPPPQLLPETLYWDAQQKRANWTHNHCCFPTKQADTLKPWRIDWGTTLKWSGVSFILVLHYINNIEQKSALYSVVQREVRNPFYSSIAGSAVPLK